MEENKINTINKIEYYLTNSLTNSFAWLFFNGEIPSFLILIFCYIDIFASLNKPVGKKATNREIFESWIISFLSDFLSVYDLQSTDLWSARCGIVHSLSSKSDHTRKGTAKELRFYISIFEEDDKHQLTDESIVYINIHHLADHLLEGVKKFFVNIREDQAIMEKFLSKWKDLIVFKTIELD